MCYKPISKHIVGLTGQARDFVFVKKLVRSRVNEAKGRLRVMFYNFSK